jgi:hypothetical protein
MEVVLAKILTKIIAPGWVLFVFRNYVLLLQITILVGVLNVFGIIVMKLPVAIKDGLAGNLLLVGMFHLIVELALLGKFV